jgi:iron complex transport system substrate-binding protein
MKRSLSIAALAALMVVSVACGDDAATTNTTAAPETSAAVTAAPESTTTVGDSVPAEPAKAIVSLSPTATEMLFAIGAADQVIAVDDQSNFPAEATAKPHDLSGFDSNVESIAALQPDLVVLQDPTLQPQLEDLGIAVWVGPAATTFDDIYAQMSQLGAATGHEDEANALIEKVKAEIAAAVAAAPKLDGGSVYLELDPTFYSVTSNTFLGSVFGLFGLANIADGIEPGNDYPQLNAEYIVQQNPTLVFLADTKCCAQTAAEVSARPGWDAIAAVQNGSVIELDDDIAQRWGPRVVDLITAISDAVVKAKAGA